MDLVDEKLQQLDESWQHWRAESALQRLVDSIPPQSESRIEAVVEMCAADLEWRYRRLNPLSREQPSHLVTAGDYSRMLHSVGADSSDRRLILAEWRARSGWGDRPILDTFAKHFPNDPDWRLALIDELDLLAGLRVRISRGEDIVEIPVTGRFNVGRQNVGEPISPSWNESTRRLLIADLHQVGVSRNQLNVERTRMQEVELHNSSSNVSLSIDRPLRPGQTRITPLPIGFQIGQLHITILSGSETFA